jgi:hypothetical protein
MKKWGGKKREIQVETNNAPADFGQVHWSASIVCWYVYWSKGRTGNM